MSKWIVILTLLALPVFAQRTRVDNMKAFRQDLSAAVSTGNLTPEEKQKYEAANKILDEQRAARKAGNANVDRQATRQAMQDLGSIAKSVNLKEEDRAKLAKHLDNARHAKGKRAHKKSPAA
jgi:hypothetical protein